MCRILIAVTDGVKGVPKRSRPLIRSTTLQTCVVHLIRNSLEFASWKQRKALAASLLPIYTAASADAAQAALGRAGRGTLGPAVSHGHHGVSPGLAARDPVLRVSPRDRRMIYTTNALESVHARVRRSS